MTRIDQRYVLFIILWPIVFPSNVIVLAIMVRPEWVSKLLESLYIVVSKTFKMVVPVLLEVESIQNINL